MEPGMGQKLLNGRLVHPAGCGKSPALILRHTLHRLHQIVDRRIGGASVKGQQSPRRGRVGKGRIDPGQIAHPAKVQEGNRSLRPDASRAGVVVKRRKRCALTAQSHVAAAEIPDHWQAQNLGQKRAVARLMRAPARWIMRQSLTMKADQIGAGNGF